MSTRWQGSNSHVSHVCVSGRQTHPWAQTRALPADPVGFVRGRCVVAGPEGPRGPQRWGGFCAWPRRFPAAAVTNDHTQWLGYHTLTVLVIPQLGSSEVQNQSVGRAGSFWRLREKPRSLPLTPVAVRPLEYAGPRQASRTISRSQDSQFVTSPKSLCPRHVTRPQVPRTKTGTVLVLLSAA